MAPTTDTTTGNGLPLHPTLLNPHTGLPLQAIGVSPRTGKVWWPVMGGAPDPDPDPKPDPKPEPKPANGKVEGEFDFPENTPLSEMTESQRSEYWRHKARKHEGRVSALGNLTPEQVAELQAKAKKADDYAAQQGTETEKAVRSAYAEAETKADAHYRPLLVKAKFEAIGAGRIDADKLATILEPLDLTKFLAADGSVDTAKVQAHVDAVAPEAEEPQRRGPSTKGAGGTGTSKPPAAEGSAAERARRRAERLGVVKPQAQQERSPGVGVRGQHRKPGATAPDSPMKEQR